MDWGVQQRGGLGCRGEGKDGVEWERGRVRYEGFMGGGIGWYWLELG